MPFEVEQKFPITDPEGLINKLLKLGATEGSEYEQTDTYFNHPSRDFASTDEALRVREETGRVCFTYKGPKIDKETKTRRELEVDIQGDAEQGREFLKALSFSRVAEVRKNRRTFRLAVGSSAVDVSIDEVRGLGSFAELELVVEAEEGIEKAKQEVGALAEQLGLSNPERRSYLELLLAGQ